MKPFSESCVQNQAEICAVLKDLLHDKKHILEIGSSTGQHAVYFAKHLTHLIWQTSDQIQYHQGIQLWLDEANLENTRNPIALDVSQDAWPDIQVGSKRLKSKGFFIFYGPFNYNGEFTSPSNANFDQWLKSRDHKSGVRDFEALDSLAKDNGMILKHDIEMAVNNRILCWEKA